MSALHLNFSGLSTHSEMNALRRDFLGTKSLPAGAPIPSSSIQNDGENPLPVADVADKNDGSSPQPSQGKKKMKPADDVVSLGDLISDIQDVFDDASKNWKKHESEIMSALVVVDHVSFSPLPRLNSCLDPRWEMANHRSCKKRQL
jgi:hypothetical protein